MKTIFDRKLGNRTEYGNYRWESECPESLVFLKKSRGRKLKKLGIESVEVMRGWRGGRGWNPILVLAITEDDYGRYREAKKKEQVKNPLTEEQKRERREAKALLVPLDVYRSMSAEERKAKAAKIQIGNRRKNHKEICAELKEKGYKLITIKKQLRIFWNRRTGITSLPYWFTALRDIREAHPAWLQETKEAIDANVEYNGQATISYVRDEIGVYEYIHLCRAANYRHNYTNYDELLRQGYSRDDARFCMEKV